MHNYSQTGCFLMTTLQTSAATLVFWLQFERRNLMCYKVCIFHGLHISHRTTWTSLEKKERLIVFLSAGVQLTQIVEVVGLSPQTVSNILTKWTGQLARESYNLLVSNCQSKYQCCHENLQSCHQKNSLRSCSWGDWGLGSWETVGAKAPVPPTAAWIRL